MERRIVFIGRTGSGKSATGNNILNGKIFKSGVCGSSVTKKCQRGVGSRNGRNVQVIDTPGLFDTRMTKEDVTKEIMKCVGMTAPGPHAFVLVVRIDRFTEEEQKTVTYFKTIFGEEMVNYLIILFTKKDDLQYEDKTFDMYLKEVPEELTDLVKACKNRCIAFNNRGTAGECAQDVEDFLNLVDGVVLENGDRCYTNEMFEEAEKIMREQEEQARKELEEQERKEIAKEVELKFKQQRDKDQSQIKKELDMRYKLSEQRIDSTLALLRERERQRINDESGSIFDKLMKSSAAKIIGGAVALIGAALVIAFKVLK